ncbi:hypothetical protein ES319_A13G122700v1, partial [Gossypium barbadense]
LFPKFVFFAIYLYIKIFPYLFNPDFLPIVLLPPPFWRFNSPSSRSPSRFIRLSPNHQPSLRSVISGVKRNIKLDIYNCDEVLDFLCKINTS